MKKIEELYTKKNKLYDRFFIQICSYRKGVKKFFENHNYLQSNYKILDAGCGTGLMAKILIELAKKNKISGTHYFGFDITQEMLNLFKQWVKKHQLNSVELQKADVLDLNQLPKNWNDYDLIVSSAMLEYIPKSNIEIAVRNISSRLKNSGTLLLFITKNNLLMWFLIKIWWQANLYKKEEIKQILINSGFKTITFRKFLFPYWRLNFWGYIIEAKK